VWCTDGAQAPVIVLVMQAALPIAVSAGPRPSQYQYDPGFPGCAREWRCLPGLVSYQAARDVIRIA
jgi:hypothetical protein